MIGRLEEFPSLRSPTAHEANPLRRKKRRLVLYFFYIFSIVAMYRLMMTIYWLCTLDIGNLRLNRLTYDTDSWKKVEVDLSFENSQSPIHVKFADVSATLLYASRDGSEHPILALRIPSANLSKNKNIVFNGDIYIEDFNKKNAIDSRLSVRFIVKIDAKLYPRLCFLRFPFHRSSDFPLETSMSAPSKTVCLKQITVGKRGKMLVVRAEVDDTKFSIPKFIALRSKGMTIFPKNSKELRCITVGPVEIERGEFLKPFSVDVEITEENSTELRKKLIRILRGDEVAFELDSFYFETSNDYVEEIIDLSLRFGFNAKDPSAYHMALGYGNQMGGLTMPVVALENSPGSGDSHFSIKVNKQLFPLISDGSYAVTAFCPTFNGELRINGKECGNIEFVIKDAGSHVLFTGTFENLNTTDILGEFIDQDKWELKLTISSGNDLGFLINGFVLRYDMAGTAEISFKEETWRLSPGGDGPTNMFEIFHDITSDDNELCINSTIVFNPLENCSPSFHSINLSNTRYAPPGLGIDIEVTTLDSELRYAVTDGTLCERLFGHLSFRTKIFGDVGDMVYIILRHLDVDNTYRPRNFTEAFFNVLGRRGAGRGSTFHFGMLDVTYKEEEAEITKHCLTMSHTATGECLQDTHRVVFRNVISVPRLEMCLKPDVENKVARRASRSSEPERGISRTEYSPVGMSVGPVEVVYVLTDKGSWIEFPQDFDVSIHFNHLYDIVVAGICGVNICPSDGRCDAVSRGVASALNAYFDQRARRIKRIVNNNIIFRLRASKMDVDESSGVRHLFRIHAKTLFPTEMLDSSRVRIHIPQIRLAMVNLTPYRSFHRGQTFFSVDIPPVTRVECDGKSYTSLDVVCDASPFPPGRISIKTFDSEGETVTVEDVFMKICLTVNNREYDAVTIKKSEFTRTLANIRTEITESLSDPKKPYVKPVLRISSDDGFEIFNEGNGISTRDRETNEMLKWGMEVCSEPLRNFLLTKIPASLLASSFGCIPSGLTLDLLVDREVIAFYVDSPKKNMCKERKKGSVENQHLYVTSIPGEKPGEVVKLYKVVDVIFSDIVFEEKIPFSFSQVCRDSAATKEEGDRLVYEDRVNEKHEVEFSPQKDSYEPPSKYRNWNLKGEFGFSVNISNCGVLYIPKMVFDAPFVYILAELFPSHDPYKFCHTFYPHIGVYFPLPFSILVASPGPLMSVNIYSNDNRHKSLGEVTFKPMDRFEDRFQIVVQIHSYLKPFDILGFRKFGIRKKSKEQHIFATVNINGYEVYMDPSQHIEIDLGS